LTNDKQPVKINYYLYILRYILIYNYYNKYSKYINIKLIKDKYRELSLVFDEAISLLEKHKRDLTLDELKLSFFVSYPKLKEEQQRAFEAIFQSLEQIEIKDDIVVDVFEKLRQRNVAYTLSDLSYAVGEGERDWDNLSEFISKMSDEKSVEQPVRLVSQNIADLYPDGDFPEGLRWRLDSLNKMLGSLRRGNFGFIVARPETGKTTFLASEVTFMAAQADSPILWFNNEEDEAAVLMRLYQAALKCHTKDVLGNPKKAWEAYVNTTRGNIQLISEAAIHRKDVEAACEFYKPSLVLFDQLDKIKGFDADRQDLLLGRIYQWAREIAKTYCPVIGVCQADGTAEGVQWITMQHVADAKTSKQAEADWILGIGKTYRDGYENVRHLHLSKNKLIGDKDTVPELRHGKRDVIIEPEIARYKDI